MAQGSAEKVWDMMEDISICMLTTKDGDQLRARPMAAYVRADDHTVYFLTDARHHTDEEIARHPQVCLAFADSDGQNYVSVSGTADVSNDRDKIRDLWSTPAKAWWQTPDDPNIRLLKVRPHDAEYWDSPGTVVSYVKMLAAAVTGDRPSMGENEKTALR